MSNVRINILSNIAGNVWVVVLTAIIVPLQIKCLGMEAFGLIGILTTLQIIFSVLDLGLSTTITRSIASDVSKDREESIKLLNSAMVFYWGMAVLIGVLILSLSEVISTDILNGVTLKNSVVVSGIYIIGVSVAVRWPVALYSGILSGIQRQDLLNIIKIICVSLRLLGGIVVILLSNDVLCFLFWVLFSSVFEVLSFYIVSRKYAPGEYFKFKLESSSIVNVWKYAIAMNVIAILSMILTNIDKLFVSKLLSLQELGYYYLAYNVAASIALIQMSINSAMYPSFSRDYSQKKEKEFINKYLNITQLTIYVCTLPASVMMFYGYEGLLIWVGVDVALQSSPSLAVLSLGFLLTATVSNSYIASIAAGKPKISVVTNSVATLIYVPVIYLLVLNYGIVGAAYGWVILNLYYFFIKMPIIYKYILNLSYSRWLWNSLAPYIVLGAACFGGVKYISNLFFDSSHPTTLIILIFSIIIYTLLGYQLLSSYLKDELKKYFIKP